MKRYCVDLKIGKELKENGFSDNLICGWYQPNFADNRNRKPVLKYISLEGTDDSYFNQKAYFLLALAPCSDEILKELPKVLELETGLFFLYIACLEPGYHVYYQTNCGEELIEFIDKSLANALANLWLYLKKKEYIK
jgi:hypothetical protein